MKVHDIFEVKGRGMVATVTDAPQTLTSKCGDQEPCGLAIGSIVCQGDNCWEVRGIEAFLIPHPQTNLGLLLVPVGDAPPMPEPGSTLEWKITLVVCGGEPEPNPPAPPVDGCCPNDGNLLEQGYGLAGGGIGEYWMCNFCDYFYKEQDPA